MRWTRPEQFHYTLKFLGELPSKRVYEAVEAAQEIARGFAPFEMTLGGAGAFPNAQRPSVLWLGALNGADMLRQLAASLDLALQGRRFRAERQPFKVHLTLARIRTYAGEAAAVRALRGFEAGEIARAEIAAFFLMQSRPEPRGSVYSVVEMFRLQGAPISPDAAMRG